MATVPGDLVSITEAYEALRDEIPRLTRDFIQGLVNRGEVRKYQRTAGGRVFVSLAEVREKAAIRPVDDDQS